MKFLSGLKLLTRKSENSTRLLLHGRLVHSFSNERTVTKVSNETLQKILPTTSRPVIFLAAPYIISFVHETIPLSRTEMEKADHQLLGFLSAPSPTIMITSVKLNDKKAVTVHSHITKKGTELLASLQRMKIGFTWYPAVSSFITNIHRSPEQLPGERNRLRVFLAGEMLQVEKQAGQFRFQHLNYLHTDQSYKDKRQTMEQILEKTEGKQVYTALVFNDRMLSEPASSEYAADSLLQLPSRGRHVKSVTLLQKKRSLALRSYLKRNHLLGLATSIIVIWAILINLHALKVNEQRLNWAKSVTILQQQSALLNEIADTKRRHARFTSIKKTVKYLRIQPALCLASLDGILPEGVWIQRISIQYNRIALELLDSGEAELSALMDKMGRQYGKTSLKSNEAVTFEKIPVRNYTLEITQLKPWNQYEKLDQ